MQGCHTPGWGRPATGFNGPKITIAMNKYFHRNFRAPMVKFSIAHISLMLGLIFAIDTPTLHAHQDFLIIRPMGNNKSVVSAREFIFEVEASAFEPILEVKINGEVQDIAQKSWVSVKKLSNYKLAKTKLSWKPQRIPAPLPRNSSSRIRQEKARLRKLQFKVH